MLPRFAFAVNHSENFEAKHFGDADKYLIYEWNNNEFVFLKEEINVFKNFDEEHIHGSQKKGQAIIKLLKSSWVNVLVSRQFGKNIQMVNRHFIPIIVYTDTLPELMPFLKKHMKWIEDEHNNRPDEFKLFTLKNGILKTSIKKAD
jgi:predicted Fe-Mo cluster-binding NifX family protein